MIPVRVDSVDGRAPLCAGFVCLMGVVALAMLISAPVHGDLFRDYGLVPARLLSTESWSLLGPFVQLQPLATHLWVHDGLLHLAVNAWWLWLFGAPLERHLGTGKFCLLAIVFTLSAALGHALICPTSIAPLVGSSGLVAGCMGAYVLVMPKGRVLMLIPTALPWTLRLHAGWFVGTWIVLQLVLAVSTRGLETEVAWWAHVSGFMCGLFAGRWLGSRNGDEDAESLTPGSV